MSDQKRLPITNQRGDLVGRIQFTEACKQGLDGLDPEDWKLSPVFRINQDCRKELIGLNLIAVPGVPR